MKILLHLRVLLITNLNIKSQYHNEFITDAFDCNIAAETGKKEVRLAYSSEYGFIETEMYWRLII